MGEYVPLKDAADRLGISVDTVRRRMRAGELVAEKRPTKQGFAWYVELPADAPPAPVTADAGTAAEVAMLRAQVLGLEGRLDELRQERDAWREQAVTSREAEAELRVLVQQAQQLAGALPPGPLHGGGDGGQAGAMPRPVLVQDAPASSPAAAAKRSKWKFWEG